jgi:hypothetical protein
VSWVRIDDAFADHPKTLSLNDRAFRLHVWALCYCARHLTDGLLTFDVLFRSPFGSRSGAKRDRFIGLVSDLCETGLWEWAEGGFAIHDYLEYNPTAAKVREDRRVAAERQARWRARQEERRNAPRNAVTETPRNALPDPAPKGAGEAAAPGGAPPEIESAPPPAEFLTFADNIRRGRAARKAEAA